MTGEELRQLLSSDPSAADRFAALLTKRKRVKDRHAALHVLWSLLAGRDTEALAVAALDRNKRVIEASVLCVGARYSVPCDPAAIFRWVLTREQPACWFVVGHNHPNGDPTPSEEDRLSAALLARLGRDLQVPMLADVVITDDIERYSYIE